MKSFVSASVLFILTLPSLAAAQSIDETYAKLSSNEEKNETCTLLRKAIFEKLSDATKQETLSDEIEFAMQGYIPTASDIAHWGFLGRVAEIGGWTDEVSGSFTLYEWVNSLTIRSRSWAVDDGQLLTSRISRLDPVSDMISIMYDYPVDENGQPTYPPPPPTKVERSNISEGSWEFDGKKYLTRVTLNQNKLITETFEIEGTTETSLGALALTGGSASSLSEAMQQFASAKAAKLEAERLAQARAAEAQANAARKKESGGGLFGTLLGAAVGVAAGEAYGLNTEQTLGAAMKGVQIMNPNSQVAAALGSTGEQLVTGQASGTSGAVGSFGGQGTYPTKPNLAISACAGFTEANYQTKALEGGGDSQLYTMCGQAFEYYTMYKRAIAQGYSEADANRTYAAHEQSARVASGYLSSHRAN